MEHDTDTHRKIVEILGYKYQQDNKHGVCYYIWIAPDGEEFSHDTAKEVCDFFQVYTLEDARDLVEKEENIKIANDIRKSQFAP